MRVKRVYERVKRILEDTPEARDNDGLLIALFDEEINPSVSGMSYGRVMAHRSELGLPTCESIRRSRQRVQEETPSLASSKAVQKMRDKQRAEYEEFVRAKE